MRRLAWNEQVDLPSGGRLRVTGGSDLPVSVLLVGGGTAQSRPGRWSASMTWLAPRVEAAVRGHARVAQLRYVDSSWKLLDGSIADVREAIDHEHDAARTSRRVVLLALSMGGATCMANADHEAVVGLVAMAPWLPEELGVDRIVPKPLRVVHGQLDNALPLVPGTSLRRSREAVAQASRLGSDASWQGVPLGLHGTAVRIGDRIVALPRARAYARLLVAEVAALVDASASGP